MGCCCWWRPWYALVWANSPWKDSYASFLDAEIALNVGSFDLHLTVLHFVNDALMAIFFFVVGIEIKRELVKGELRDRRAAALPIIGALGGMVVPALLYFVINAGTPESHGWGIPMATDIAFAVGIVSLSGKRVPAALKVFLLSLAVADDLGAITVIAIFYSSSVAFLWLVAAALLLVGVWVLRRRARLVRAAVLRARGGRLVLHVPIRCASDGGGRGHGFPHADPTVAS